MGHGFSNLEVLVGLIVDSESYQKHWRRSGGSFHPFDHMQHRDPDGYAIVELGPLELGYQT